MSAYLLFHASNTYTFKILYCMFLPLLALLPLLIIILFCPPPFPVFSLSPNAAHVWEPEAALMPGSIGALCASRRDATSCCPPRRTLVARCAATARRSCVPSRCGAHHTMGRSGRGAGSCLLVVVLLFGGWWIIDG